MLKPLSLLRNSSPSSRVSFRSVTLAGLLALMLPVAALGQSLVYEREFTLIAEADNTLRMTLEANDRLTVERPVFMTRSGRFEFQLPAGSHARMASELTRVAVDSRALDEDVQRRAANEFRHVSDDEISRFLQLDEQRQPLTGVEVISLEPWAVQFPDDVRLAALLEFERDWYALMDQAMAGGAR
jgi:hypothetical protein